MKTTRPSPARQRLVALLAGLAFSLLCGEGLARLLPAPIGFASKMSRFRDAVLAPDQQLGWRIRPGAQVAIDGIDYRFDALGARGTDLPLDADRPKILLVGDSVTLGWGVPEEATFAARLQRELCGERCRVVDAGVVGYGIQQDVAHAKTLADKLNPSLVVLGYYPNDPEDAESAPGLGGPRWSRLWLLVRPGIEALCVRAGLLPTASEHHRRLHAEGGAGWRRVTEGFAQLAAACRARAVPCVVALLPELQRSPDALADVRARLSREIEANGLTVVDLAPAVEDVEPRTLWVAPDDAHPNAIAHARYAAALLPVLSRLIARSPLAPALAQ